MSTCFSYLKIMNLISFLPFRYMVLRHFVLSTNQVVNKNGNILSKHVSTFLTKREYFYIPSMLKERERERERDYKLSFSTIYVYILVDVVDKE